MRAKKTIIAILGIWLGLAFSQAQALNVIPITGEAPNYYACKGKNVSLFFYDKSFDNNTTLLEIILTNTKYTFHPQDIQSQTTPMGTLVTVNYSVMPDVNVKKASFIIPDIRLGSNGFGPFMNDASFTSQLILTTVATPYTVKPFIGVLESSSFISLNCKASLVFVPLYN